MGGALLANSQPAFAQQTSAASAPVAGQIGKVQASEDIDPFANAAEANKAINAVEDYLNSISSIRARFNQRVTPKEIPAGMSPQQVEQALQGMNGTFYMQRPSKFRLEYDAPAQMLSVADGRQYIYYDAQLEQTTYVPFRKLPFYFLFKARVNLRDPLLNINVLQDTDVLALRVQQKADPDVPAITFIFQKNPMQLVSWTYNDQQGNPVMVSLSKLETNIPLSAKLFRFKNPRLAPKVNNYR